MREEKLYRYYMFGYNYYALLRTSEWTNISLLKHLEEYFDFIKELELPVTQSGIEMNDLDEELNELKKINRTKANHEELVDSSFVSRLQEKLEKIDNILDAELSTKVGYIPSEKRYQLKYMIKDIGCLFAKGVYNYLPNIASFDFKEAGMCIALDRYTACAFHALRGTEDTLKLYYIKLLKKTTTGRKTWGTFVNEIRKGNFKPAPPEELLINLDSLRKYYRNQTQHPVLIYTSDEALDLLGLCIKTVNEIIQDLLKRKLIK